MEDDKNLETSGPSEAPETQDTQEIPENIEVVNKDPVEFPHQCQLCTRR